MRTLCERHVDKFVEHLGILVGHDGADGFHDGRRGEVLRRDQLQALAIELALCADDMFAQWSKHGSSDDSLQLTKEYDPRN